MDKTVVALVSSNVAVVVAVVALLVSVVSSGPPGPPSQTAPPRVSLGTTPCLGASRCWEVTVASVSVEMPLWRFAVTLSLGERYTEPPATLTGTGNLWFSLTSGAEGTYVNFTDTDGDGNLSAGDMFVVDRLVTGVGIYALRLLWAETMGQLQYVLIIP